MNFDSAEVGAKRAFIRLSERRAAVRDAVTGFSVKGFPAAALFRVALRSTAINFRLRSGLNDRASAERQFRSVSAGEPATRLDFTPGVTLAGSIRSRSIPRGPAQVPRAISMRSPANYSNCPAAL